MINLTFGSYLEIFKKNQKQNVLLIVTDGCKWMQSMSIIFELLTSCGKKVIDNLYFEKLSRDLSCMTKCFENFSKAQ